MNMDEVYCVDLIEGDHESKMRSGPRKFAGGSGANTAALLSCLGSNVTVVGSVGDDRIGKELLSSLQRLGVDTSLVVPARKDLATGSTMILVDELAKRLIIVRDGANDELSVRANMEEIKSKAILSRVVHLSSFVGDRELMLQEEIAEFISGKCVCSLSPGALYAKRKVDGIKNLLKNIHLLFLYREQFELMMTDYFEGRDLKGIHTRTLMGAYFQWRSDNKMSMPHIVLVKEKGSIRSSLMKADFMSVGIGSSSLEEFIRPDELRSAGIQAVDTTGAGDAAAAGFIRAILQGAGINACANLAFACAAFASTQLGARGAYDLSS